jgi:hypothetical protein
MVYFFCFAPLICILGAFHKLAPAESNVRCVPLKPLFIDLASNETFFFFIGLFTFFRLEDKLLNCQRLHLCDKNQALECAWQKHKDVKASTDAR